MITKEDLKRPEYKNLRNNLHLMYSPRPTKIGTLLILLGALGDLVFTIGLVVVLVVDTDFTWKHMLLGLAVSLAMQYAGNAYDSKFAEIDVY